MGQKLKQDGFHIVLIVAVLVVFAVVGAIGYAVFNNAKNNTSAEVLWSYNEEKDEWFVRQGAAPVCKEPYKFDYTPVDISMASSVGFAGTYRGKSYKVHGGFGLIESSTVKLPADATLSGLTRYYEGDPLELQYIVSFETDCGVAFYFDHLHTLSPQLEQIAKTRPEPKANDTRSDPSNPPPRIKMSSGDLVATETGQHNAQRYGIDFGVVDYRQRNMISRNSEWAALHSQYKASEWFGVCWFDMLPRGDDEKAKQLSLVQIDSRKVAKYVSDYCDNADYITLDFNDGQPVDGY